MAFTGSDIIKTIGHGSWNASLVTFGFHLSFAIILPPVGVFLERGCNVDFLINILLTVLGYLPGIIHALYIILKY
ncbi:hypothetical protein BC835DRAFT_1416013 [Cytidiella melzeri]|nr:hypothetical protein BC835DRAFT_1416013 [Cytidiella melzeri]